MAKCYSDQISGLLRVAMSSMLFCKLCHSCFRFSPRSLERNGESTNQVLLTGVTPPCIRSTGVLYARPSSMTPTVVYAPPAGYEASELLVILNCKYLLRLSPSPSTRALPMYAPAPRFV